eukprot:TRINITY_DN1437_c0_g1_i1.p1 TRINITY_DN1437_c0_g1~~TRINITY_DN1437_c0_g1_i1.p1  ORF type:complete len:203 (-),score=47.53 TRINITY_DN1437_c0_g1_i1:62-670(-)
MCIRDRVSTQSTGENQHLRPMSAYHSKFNDFKVLGQEPRNICNIPILPIKTKTKGIAPPCPDGQEDIIDELFYLFKPNVLFRNFEVKGLADRLMVYLILYLTKLLRVVATSSQKINKKEAVKLYYTTAIENFLVPGDAQFPLGGLVTAPTGRKDSDDLRAYFTQLRQEIGIRFVDILYKNDENTPDKWWMCFSKRKFLNMEI